MKILIVEDEKKTGEYLTKGLTEAGFVVDLADNGLNGYHLAMTGDYDLLILDIMLAGREWLGYCPYAAHRQQRHANPSSYRAGHH
ncbi:DNA-binding transcriptional activator CusR [Citrobacter koseri]|uniref:DNA-binding transcriptional activator CusR n=1 Tax=Citrobacter koseri TaxID=545 RepID=A0A2X2V715_CITKO|nr:DNA-binding transcriptional activator CusR [Citrobacter koseri]